MPKLNVKTYQSRKKLLEDIEKLEPDVITGTISELKKLSISQGQELKGVPVKPDPELIDANEFETRDKLDAYVKRVLGDNLTLNRVNGHYIQATKDQANKLFLGEDSNVYGCRVEII